MQSAKLPMLIVKQFNSLQLKFCYIPFFILQFKIIMLKLSFFRIILIFIAAYAIYRGISYFDNTQLDGKNSNLSFLKIRTTKELQVNDIYIKTDENIQQIKITFQNKPIFIRFKRAEKIPSVNFIMLAQGKGQINGHGDSFYQIKDQFVKVCDQQTIDSIEKNQSQDGNGSIIIKGQFIGCQDSSYELQLSSNKNNPNHLQFHIQAKNPKYNRVQINFQQNQNTKFYGLGQQFSYLQLKKPYSLFVRQKGVTRGYQPYDALAKVYAGINGDYYQSYNPTPIWFTNQNIGYFYKSYGYMTWKYNRIQCWNNKVDITIFTKNSIKELIKQITNFNGYTPPVPNWVNNGAILGLQGGTEQVLQKYNRMKAIGTKISGLWIQDWVTKRQSLGFSRLWWNWQLDQDHYPNWNKLMENAKSENVKILTYLNCMLSDPSTKTNHKRNFFQQANQQNAFVKLKNNKYFQCSAFTDYKSRLINFYSDQGKKFYRKVVDSVIKQTSINGFMLDFGQSYPVQDLDISLQKSTQLHNKYPVQYHKTVYQFLKEQNLYDDLFYFTRSGYLGSANYTRSLWAGDQMMTFNQHAGLPSCLTAILSSGLVGFSNTHCDIGGYTYASLFNNMIQVKRTKKLMIYWSQLAAFTAVFRTHQGNKPQAVLQVYNDQIVGRNFAFYSHIFSVLANYRQQQAAKAALQKLPLVRPLFLQHEMNKDVWQIDDQFYLGEQILVAPFVQGNYDRNYYLPKIGEKWVNLWTSQQVQGCDCYIQNKQKIIPAFIKQSSKHKDELLNKIKLLIRDFSQIFSEKYEKELYDL